MMRIVNYPEPSTWASLLERPVQDIMSLLEVVRPIYDRIKSEGDRAVYEYEELFDHVRLARLAILLMRTFVLFTQPSVSNRYVWRSAQG